MFKTPVSTIRDVAELTEVSPSLIARILGEMRGPDGIANLESKLREHETRIKSLESSYRQSSVDNKNATSVSQEALVEIEWQRYKRQLNQELMGRPLDERLPGWQLYVAIIVVLIVVVFALQYSAYR